MKSNSQYKIFTEIGVPEGSADLYDFQSPVMGAIYLSNSLQMTASENGIYGLSAPQVGVNARVVYLAGFESAMFNPKIIEFSENEVIIEEHSVSFAGLLLKVKRPEIVRVRWTDAHGVTRTDTYAGLTARILQRKIDYLDGIDFTTKVSKLVLDRAKRKMEKRNVKSD